MVVARSEIVTNLVTDLTVVGSPSTSVAVIAKLIAAFPTVPGYVTVTFEMPVVVSDAADATDTVAPIIVTTGVVAVGIFPNTSVIFVEYSTTLEVFTESETVVEILYAGPAVPFT